MSLEGLNMIPKQYKTTKTCVYCGKTYTASAPNQLYCTKECRNKAIAERQEQTREKKNRNARLLYLDKKMNARANRVDIKNKSIAKICQEANDHNMTYGQYIAWLEYGQRS